MLRYSIFNGRNDYEVDRTSNQTSKLSCAIEISILLNVTLFKLCLGVLSGIGLSRRYCFTTSSKFPTQHFQSFRNASAYCSPILQTYKKLDISSALEDSTSGLGDFQDARKHCQ